MLSFCEMLASRFAIRQSDALDLAMSFLRTHYDARCGNGYSLATMSYGPLAAFEAASWICRDMDLQSNLRFGMAVALLEHSKSGTSCVSLRTVERRIDLQRS